MINHQNMQRKWSAYGFVAFVVICSFYTLYFLWALVPDEFLNKIALNNLPDKHWAIIVPLNMIVFPLIISCLYITRNLHKTLPLDSMNTICDEFSFPEKHAKNLETREDGEMFDLPLSYVNKKMFQNRPSCFSETSIK
ncbi:hypothetical protein MHBO_001759 [Bonamia ostreae]|uniref:PIG-P domain-containing protein n=1 Tax=Bonamia ostreae TaxID=126728 RepID=A0ABV2AK36_9EUKA